MTSTSLPSADDVLSALGDPTRRRMVEVLGRGPLSVTRLAEPFDMSLTAIGQHLRVLEECGLVATEKVGRVRTCRLRSEALDALVAWAAQQRSDWDRRLDRLVNLAGGS